MCYLFYAKVMYTAICIFIFWCIIMFWEKLKDHSSKRKDKTDAKCGKCPYPYNDYENEKHDK